MHFLWLTSYISEEYTICRRNLTACKCEVPTPQKLKANKYIAQRKQTMKIVFLDSKTIGDDIDLSEYDKLGEVVKYDFRQQRKQRSAQGMLM